MHFLFTSWLPEIRVDEFLGIFGEVKCNWLYWQMMQPWAWEICWKEIRPAKMVVGCCGWLVGWLVGLGCWLEDHHPTKAEGDRNVGLFSKVPRNTAFVQISQKCTSNKEKKGLVFNYLPIHTAMVKENGRTQSCCSIYSSRAVFTSHIKGLPHWQGLGVAPSTWVFLVCK